MSFEACLPIILQSEGGFVDDIHDPGGATNLGITIHTLSSWIGHPATIADVQALTPETVAPIYRANYYNAAHACDCPDGVDLMVFDEAVNQGVGRAVRSLQTAAGVAADGMFGPVTKAAVEAAGPAALIDAIAKDREAHYRSLPIFPRYGNGWLSRLSRTSALARNMLT